MSIELKQAAQQAVDAFDAYGDADDFASLFELTQKMRALSTAIQQAESEPVYQIRGDIFDCPHAWRDATEEAFYVTPVSDRRILYTHPAPGVPEFSRIAKRKLTDLQEHGFAITGYAIQRGPVRGFIDGGGFVGWWQGEPDPGVPDGWKLVPIDPTAEMLQAALKVATPGALRAAWARMLAASPAQKGGE